jgi:hypothetical protein
LDFRFFLLCKHTTRTDAGSVTLHDILATVAVAPATPLKFQAVVSLVMVDEFRGKRLALTTWKLGKKQERLTIPGYVGTHVTLPSDYTGPTECPYPIQFVPPESGLYGCDLLDPEGIFGTQNRLLATFLFGVQLQ